MSTETLLQLKNIHVHYGGVRALDGASVAIDEGEIVALMGPNGAGKSTILKAIFGLAPIDSGEVLWEGRRFKPVSYEVVERGVSFVPQGRRVFHHLTVMENLEVGGYRNPDRALPIAEVLERFPRLRERADQLAGTLSGGEQQMLALGRALAARPRLVLLDEPSMGLSPVLVRDIFKIIQDINRAGKTILLVEQNANMSLHIASRGYVLETGRIVLSGTGKALTGNPRVKEAYLGG